jgi:hypothetical protein
MIISFLGATLMLDAGCGGMGTLILQWVKGYMILV